MSKKAEKIQAVTRQIKPDLWETVTRCYGENIYTRASSPERARMLMLEKLHDKRTSIKKYQFTDNIPLK